VTITTLLSQLDAEIADPHQGLPSEVFLLASRLPPRVNVDLLEAQAPVARSFSQP